MADITKTPIRTPDTTNPEEVRRTVEQMNRKTEAVRSAVVEETAAREAAVAAITYSYSDGVQLVSGTVSAKVVSPLAISSTSIVLSAAGFTDTTPDSSTRLLADNGAGGWERHSLTSIRQNMFSKSTISAYTAGAYGTTVPTVATNSTTDINASLNAVTTICTALLGDITSLNNSINAIRTLLSNNNIAN